jgi:siroheme synthase
MPVHGQRRSGFRAIPTLVVLMAGRTLPLIAQRLIGSGWRADTPVAVVREAGLPSQRVWRTSLASAEHDTATAEGGLSPCVVIIGRVVAEGD